jgi:uncharacterized protein (DUF2336 family)
MASSKLYDLIELAKEPSSDRRRDLLRGVTDLFLTQPSDQLDPSQMELFDDVMGRIASEMEEAVRVELSSRLAPSPAAPRGVLRSLARDSLAVAEPVLRHSSALSEADLIEVARTHGQGHLRAISQREAVPEAVSDVIVEHGDDTTLGVLLRNEGAELSRQASETAVDRAHANPELQEAVVERRKLPPDLLNELYFVVEAQLREKIMQRNAEMDPQQLQAALEAGRNRLASRDGAVPEDFAAAMAEIQGMAKRNLLTPTTLTAMLRQGEKTKFTIALAQMAEIDFPTARRILEGRQVDPLAIVCKAAGFERALFLTFVVLMLNHETNTMGRAQEYGELYNKLDRETALRAIRFWRLRRQTSELKAA